MIKYINISAVKQTDILSVIKSINSFSSVTFCGLINELCYHIMKKTNKKTPNLWFSESFKFLNDEKKKILNDG